MAVLEGMRSSTISRADCTSVAITGISTRVYDRQFRFQKPRSGNGAQNREHVRAGIGNEKMESFMSSLPLTSHAKTWPFATKNVAFVFCEIK
jgi:hypothetical protein